MQSFISIIEQKRNLSDEDLIALIKKGDLTSFDIIYERYKKPLVNYVNRLSNNYAYSEDIVQEIFLKVHINLHQFDDTRKFKNWIYRIAHNHSIGVFVREYKKKTVSIDDEECILQLEGSETQIDEMIMLSEKSQQMIKSINKLKEKYTQVLIDYYYRDMSYRQIAKERGIQVNTVGTLLTRARQELAIQSTLTSCTQQSRDSGE